MKTNVTNEIIGTKYFETVSLDALIEAFGPVKSWNLQAITNVASYLRRHPEDKEISEMFWNTCPPDSEIEDAEYVKNYIWNPALYKLINTVLYNNGKHLSTLPKADLVQGLTIEVLRTLQQWDGIHNLASHMAFLIQPKSRFSIAMTNGFTTKVRCLEVGVDKNGEKIFTEETAATKKKFPNAKTVIIKENVLSIDQPVNDSKTNVDVENSNLTDVIDNGQNFEEQFCNADAMNEICGILKLSDIDREILLIVGSSRITQKIVDEVNQFLKYEGIDDRCDVKSLSRYIKLIRQRAKYHVDEILAANCTE